MVKGIKNIQGPILIKNNTEKDIHLLHVGRFFNFKQKDIS